MSEVNADVLKLATQVGTLALEYYAGKRLAKQDREETLRAVAAATAAFRPKPTAEAIAEGAAAAGGGEGEGGEDDGA